MVLISPYFEIFPFSFTLQFDNNNNTSEYEDLLLGLEMARQKGIQNLKVQGDAELIVNQVRGTYQVKNDHLRHYRNKVWDNIKCFDAFSIKVVLRDYNDKSDSLAIFASLLLPHPKFKQDTYTIEIVYHPSVPDNSSHL